VKRLLKVDTTLLKARLHEAVDQIVDEFIRQDPAAGPAAAAGGAEEVETIGPVEAFTYSWPADYGSEDFKSGTAYRLSTLAQDASVIVGWTTRNAWNRDRRRAVVFHRARPHHEPGRWYPWTEFVETDTGRFAAPIPNPQRPRAIMRDVTALPGRFAGKTVARSDEVFDSIREGASLRLVVDKPDEVEMVRHGYWVARLRGRV
jgi:hypothetical protein